VILNYRPRLSTLLCAAVCALVLTTGSEAEETVPRSGIFILIDISATWLSKQEEDQNNRVLSEVNRAVIDLLSKTETPAAVYVITIEADSVLNRPLCEAVYRRTLLSSGTKAKGEFNRREELVNYLDLCRAAVLRRPPAQWTDIHGALDMVSRIVAGGYFTHRYMFVLSDFKEERPKGDLPRISLTGFRVASIYRILQEDSRNPRGHEDRMKKWHATLNKAGTEKVIDAVDKTKFAGSVVRKLLARE